MYKEYGWKDVSVVVLGRTIEGITDVKIKRKVNKEYLRGRGIKPQAVLSGNEEFPGKLVLHRRELDAINRAIKSVNPSLDITKVGLDIIIDYSNDEGMSDTDLVVSANVEEYEKGLAQGDTHENIELPFMALDFKEHI